MLKSNLARELRKRQYALGEVSRELIDAVTDDQMIDSYITCSCCGEKQVDNTEQLSQIIADSDTVDIFFDKCNDNSDLKFHTNNDIDDIIKNKGF